MLSRILSLLCLSVALITLMLWRSERLARESIEEKLQQLAPDSSKSIKSYGLDANGVAMPRPSATPEVLIEQTPKPAPTIAPPSVPAETPALPEIALYGIESRVSSIGKIVNLNPQQRERLQTKYTQEALARRRGEKADTESLEEIIGEADSRFYKQQLENAYKKAQDQELERDLYYMSRRLSFNQLQENSVRDALSQVENAVQERFQSEHSSPQYASDPSYRVRLMMQENQFRSEWLAGKLKEILNPDQFQAYMQEEAESTGAELNMWHAP